MTAAHASPTQNPLAPASARGARFWPLAVVALLVAGAGSTFTLLYAAISDGPQAVEPRYYERALDWDRVQAQMAVNQRLSWSARLLIPAHADATGLRQVRLTLADRTNAPVTGGVVRVEAFANADATRRVTAVATAAAEPGVYVLAIPLKRPGKWEFRLIAQRGSDTFTSTQSVDVPHAETASDAIND